MRCIDAPSLDCLDWKTCQNICAYPGRSGRALSGLAMTAPTPIHTCYRIGGCIDTAHCSHMDTCSFPTGGEMSAMTKEYLRRKEETEAWNKALSTNSISHLTPERAADINETFEAMKVKTVPNVDSNVEATLVARAQIYGDFTDNATISQEIKNTLRKQPNWLLLSRPHREALEMIAQKIARILNGDPEYKDNWHDIAGYAQLAEARCKEEVEEKGEETGYARK